MTKEYFYFKSIFFFAFLLGDVKNSALHRLIAESPAPADLKRPRLSSPDEEDLMITPDVSHINEEDGDDNDNALKNNNKKWLLGIQRVKRAFDGLIKIAIVAKR